MATAQGEDVQIEIGAAVAVALESFDFYRRKDGERDLLRRSGEGAPFERLIDGSWVSAWFAYNAIGGDDWEKATAPRLENHTRRYLIGDLTAGPVRWSSPRRRLRLSRAGRWLLPPLKGGAGRKLHPLQARRARAAYRELLRDANSGELPELKEQATRGCDDQRTRVGGIEQRANYFLGAAALTTSLVLANAGLLLGTGKLEGTWRDLAAAALAAASVCAVLSGYRSLQATMITFSRAPADNVTRIVRRRRDTEDRMQRSYIAALLVAQARMQTIADWKVTRLGSARRWFLGVIAGVVVLTGFVLGAAVSRGADESDPPPAQPSVAAPANRR